VFLGSQMDGSQGYVVQYHQDAMKMGTNDATRDGRMYREDGRRAKSVTTVSTDVA
jgi:hypothetical protein